VGRSLGKLLSRVKGKGATGKGNHNKCGFRLDYGVQVCEDYKPEQDRPFNMWNLLEIGAIRLSFGHTNSLDAP